jgi:mannose-6-phosphate isomerase-like protein (cupin superfamily)
VEICSILISPQYSLLNSMSKSLPRIIFLIFEGDVNMMKIYKDIAQHYEWGDKCDGWFLENEQDRTIIQERMPTGTSESRHVHQQAKQFFFILSGSAMMEMDGTIYELKAHEAITVRPGVAHRISNESDEDVAFLVISTPTTRGDRFPA